MAQPAPAKPSSFPALWMLEIYVGDAPIVLVEQGWTAKQARSRMIYALNQQPARFFNHMFPYALVTPKTLTDAPKGPITVWDGSYLYDDEKHYAEQPSIFKALCFGYLERIPNGATFMLSSCSV